MQNWGRVPGQMHASTKGYGTPSEQVKRPPWPELHTSKLMIEQQVPKRLPVVCERTRSLLGEILSLPQSRDCHGLIHGDFNDGNFTVDYSNGDITVFENTLSDAWLARLSLFVRLIQVEEFLHYVQCIDEPDEEMQAELGHKIKCIEDDRGLRSRERRSFGPSTGLRMTGARTCVLPNPAISIAMDGTF